VAVVVAMLVMALPALASATPNYAISDDLVGQMTGKCIKASVKVHPTVWIDTYDCETGEQIEEFAYRCLNPYDNPEAEFCFDVHIFSNLPFYKQITFNEFVWDEPQPEALLSYEFDAALGEWVLVENPAGAGPDVIPADMQAVFVDGQQIESGWISPLIGDVDTHEDVENIRWRVGPIDWCVTAGYYTGELCVAVYQN
jgi:hypothetical protein